MLFAFLVRHTTACKNHPHLHHPLWLFVGSTSRSQPSSLIKDLTSQQERQEWARLAATYGFDEADTPAIADMHEAASLIAGGTLVALSAVMGLPEGATFTSEDECSLHVFHPAGGLHHAWPERASGFCIYNDIAVAIAHVLQESEAKVLRLDFDAHHGDGVQRAFYDEPRVMTISLHETGRYLFPGSGEELDLGQGLGRNSSEQPLPAQLPPEWVACWQATEAEKEAEQRVMGKRFEHIDFPTTFEDLAQNSPTQPREAHIRQANRRTGTLLRQLLLPPPLRQAFPLPRPERHSPLQSIFDRFHLRNRAIPSRTKTLETAKGPIFLRDACPPSLIERLKAEEGLRAFARLPEREHQLLLSIARSPDCELTIAHSPAGEIIGQVTLTPGDEWFDGLGNAYEITIEASAHWRGIGLAHQLLTFALELDMLEEIILFVMGLCWHWDTEGLKITPHMKQTTLIGSSDIWRYT